MRATPDVIAERILMGLLLGIILNTRRTWGRVTLPASERSMREVRA